MNLIPIKRGKIKKNDEEIEVFLVPAMSITQSGGKTKKVPHPEGNDSIVFPSLDQAIEAVNIAGFSYSLYKTEAIAKPKMTYSNEKDFNAIIKPLINLLKDKSSDVVASAVYSLGEIGCYEAINPLVEALGREDNNIRKNTIETLAKIGEMALPSIIKALDDENWVTRNSAAICLGEMAALNDFSFVQALGPLLNRLNDNNPIVKSSAAIALGKIYKSNKKQCNL